jgi:methyl-accepting chemotaxis protein
MFDFLKYYLDRELVGRLDSISSAVANVNEKLEDILATQEELGPILARIDAATTEAATTATGIATRITALEETIKTMGLDGTQEAALLAQLAGVANNAEKLATFLKPLASNPAEPVPAPAPEPLQPV